jgi:hypothetical protein
MKLIRKLYQRAAGILGHDREGKPLRLADEVLILPLSEVKRKYLGLTAQIMGVRDDGDLYLDIPGHDGGLMYGSGSSLKRIDLPDSASWDEVSRLLGWKPGAKAPAKEPEVVES